MIRIIILVAIVIFLKYKKDKFEKDKFEKIETLYEKAKKDTQYYMLNRSDNWMDDQRSRITTEGRYLVEESYSIWDKFFEELKRNKEEIEKFYSDLESYTFYQGIIIIYLIFYFLRNYINLEIKYIIIIIILGFMIISSNRLGKKKNNSIKIKKLYNVATSTKYDKELVKKCKEIFKDEDNIEEFLNMRFRYEKI